MVQVSKMAEIRIRGVDSGLAKKLKIRAIESGMTLRAYVVKELAGVEASRRSVGADKSGVLTSTESPATAETPKEVTPKKRQTCGHGVRNGWRCWKCGGPAR